MTVRGWTRRAAAGGFLLAVACAVLCCGERQGPPDQGEAAWPAGGELAGVEEAPGPPRGFTEADFETHVKALRAKLPTGFAVVVQPPFVVIGDEPPETVGLRAERTVKWAVDRLKRDYFERDPDRIIDIWLLRDDASYRKWSREVFGRSPETPFGYALRSEGALVMNIATGGGTLVHEIVHPFIASNFPGCPAWLNEGLASLYEQSGERDGHIVGLTNWRLKGLQDAIRRRAVLSFEDLTRLSEGEFYGRHSGLHYAQARYLCYYLQEQGLLVRFYHELRAGRQHDPTGYQTLKKVLGEEDMEAFLSRWEAFVLRLTFR